MLFASLAAVPTACVAAQETVTSVLVGAPEMGELGTASSRVEALAMQRGWL